MTWYVEHLHRDGTVLARVAVTGEVCRIGRDLGNDLVLDDPHCAAHHAELRIAPDGSAQLQDLGTRNGIHPQRGKRQSTYTFNTVDTPPAKGPSNAMAPYRLGSSLVRIRGSHWPLPPEVALSLRAIWPMALLVLALVLGRFAWDIWLTDVSDKPPTYVAELSGMAAALCVWSAMYALLGRILGGVDRFFTHLLIAGSAVLAATLVHTLLDALAFSSGWLWPMRIAPYVTVLAIALTIRAHLRVADPRHWPVLRWGVAVATTLGIAVPIAQIWINNHRLTNVQVLSTIEHPALRWAQPVSIATFVDANQELKSRADQARANDGDEVLDADDGDID